MKSNHALMDDHPFTNSEIEKYYLKNMRKLNQLMGKYSHI